MTSATRPPTRPPATQRLAALAAELRMLRGHAARPLPELVGEVERVLGLDIEVAARPGADPAGSHADLDAFADAAAAFAGDEEEPTLGAFLAYLTAAEAEEFGLEAGRVGDTDSVKLATVHAAKGLQWAAVFVPGLSGGAHGHVFPARPKLTTRWTENPRLLPFGAPRGRRRPAGARRAWTRVAGLVHRARARTGNWPRSGGWPTWPRPGPRTGWAAPATGGATACRGWARRCSSRRCGPRARPARGRSPPGPPSPRRTPRTRLLAEPATASGRPPRRARGTRRSPRRGLVWPRSPRPGPGRAGPAGGPSGRGAGGRTGKPGRQAARTAHRAAEAARIRQRPLIAAWERDTDLLLAERAQRRGDEAVTVGLPRRLPVSSLVTMARDPAELAQQVRRPMPRPPAPLAARHGVPPLAGAAVRAPAADRPR